MIGTTGSGEYLNFPYTLAQVISAIRYGYDELALTWTTTALDTQTAEFSKMSDYRLDDSNDDDCHCRFLPVNTPWSETLCMPYSANAPAVSCACPNGIVPP